MTKTIRKNFRLTPTGASLLKAISEQSGISQNAVVELAIRREAEARLSAPKKERH